MVKTTTGFWYRFSQLNQSVVTCASFKLQPQFLIFSDHKTTHWTCVEYTAEDSGKTRSHASSIPGTTPWIWGDLPLWHGNLLCLSSGIILDKVKDVDI